MTERSEAIAVRNAAEEKKREIRRAQDILAFNAYCKDKGISIVRDPTSYSIWSALHNYNSTYVGAAKKSWQDQGPVQLTASKAMKVLECDIAKQMVNSNLPEPTFETLMTNIENSVQKLTARTLDQIELNIAEIFSMLCLLSGDTLAWLKNTARLAVYRDNINTILDKIESIQQSFYKNIAQQLGLPETTARHEIRNTLFSREKNNQKLISSTLEATALTFTEEILEAKVFTFTEEILEAKVFTFTEEINVCFQDYFNNTLYTLTRLNVREMLGEEFSLPALLPHLKDTDYENELRTAIYILDIVSPHIVSPQNHLLDDIAVWDNNNTSTSNAKKMTDPEIEQATVASPHANGEQIAALVEYCVDQKLAIPNTKGSSDFYHALDNTIQSLCRQYAADEKFLDCMRAKLASLTKSKNEISMKADAAIAQVKEHYHEPSGANAFSKRLHQEMLKVKKDNIKNTIGAAGEKECAQLDKKIALLEQHFQPRATDNTQLYGDTRSGGTFYKQPSAPPAVTEQNSRIHK